MTPAPTRKRSGLRQREETRAHLDAHGMCHDWPKPPIWPGDLPLQRPESAAASRFSNCVFILSP